jgi:hypothetical protein
MRPYSTALLAALTLTVSACVRNDGVGSQSPAAKAVQKILSEKTPGTIVGITLTGSSLNVNLINSPLKKLPHEQKEVKARELALLAYTAYADRAQIKSVRVVYVVLDTALVVIATNDSSDAFTFDATELGSHNL